MASAPRNPSSVLGRVDSAGRLTQADPELAALQAQAGSRIGAALALPQVAAIARLARKLGIGVVRPARIAASDRDIELVVRASPDGDEVRLELENWVEQPAAGPRLAALFGQAGEPAQIAGAMSWTTNEELKLVAISPDLAESLGIEPAGAIGQPLTRLFRLEENADGEMPLLLALAGRQAFDGQAARPRVGGDAVFVLSGEIVRDDDGRFAGYEGRAKAEGSPPVAAEPNSPGFDRALDEALRTPLDRIIESADRIVERSDGPLRSDYAGYASDIAAAARHLLSVVHSMSEEPGQRHQSVDLAALAAEAVVLLEPQADERNVTIVLEPCAPLPTRGEERGVIQILVNLIGNAVRHSPKGGAVSLRFDRGADTAAVTVVDQGPGIDPADQERIFERFERARAEKDGTGLGLAIARRLARAMGGDITLESAPGIGARFTLRLPVS